MTSSYRRPERRNDLLVNLCASRAQHPNRYTKAEHEAALDQLLSDIDAFDLAPIVEEQRPCSISVKKKADSDSGFRLVLSGV